MPFFVHSELKWEKKKYCFHLVFSSQTEKDITFVTSNYYKCTKRRWDYPNASSPKWNRISYCLMNKEICRYSIFAYF